MEAVRRTSSADRALGREPEPPRAALLDLLASARSEEGDYDRALRLRREAIAILEAPPGADPVEVAALRGNLGNDLADLGRLDEAIVAVEAQVAVYRERLGPGNLRLANALANLGSVL